MRGRWLIVAALFTVVYAISNPFAAFGVFLPVLADTFGWSRGAISVALSINLLLGGAAGFAVGALADRIGPRALLLGTTALAATGFALASTVTALWQLYAFVGVMGGLGMSGFYVISTVTVARWFTTGRGLATGLVLTGFNLGFITGGPLAASLIAAVGWRRAALLLGSGFGAVGLAAAALVRDPPGTRDHGRAGHAPGGADSTVRGALADPRLWTFGLGWLLLGGVLMVVSVHVVPFARDLGIRLDSASLVLTAYGAGAVLGRVLFGAASDRLGSRLALHVCGAVQVVALAGLLGSRSLATLVALMAAFGFGFAGADTVVVRTIPDLFGVRALGAIMGLFSIGWRFGAAVAPALAGFVYDATGSYRLPFGAAPVAVLLSLVFFTLAGRRRPPR